MRRRIIGLTLCLALIATAAFAVDIPTKQIYCRALKRLADAAGQGKRLEWTVSLSPQNMDTVSAGAQAVIAALSAEGDVFANEDGGRASAALTLNGTELIRAQSAAGEGWRTFSLGDRTYLAAEDSLSQAGDALGLGALGALLFSLDYDWVSRGQTPYVTPVYDAGLTLWRLASPYAADSNRLSTGSGATSHALVYEIDTQGLREIVGAFADAYEGKTLFLPGIGREEQAAFFAKVRDFAQNAEVSRTLKASMTFGEGDTMRTAKLSGSIRMNGRTAGLSYTYSCGVSSTRMTRKYSLRYEPPVGDTISLSATYLTSSSGKGGAQCRLSARVSGKYDGQSYAITLESATVNKYVLGEDRVLAETLTGDLSAQVKFGGEKLLSLDFSREGSARSNNAGLAELSDVYTGKLVLRGATAFEGSVACTARAGDRGEIPALEMNGVTNLATLDEAGAAAARESLAEIWREAQARAIALLPDEAKRAVSAR